MKHLSKNTYGCASRKKIAGLEILLDTKERECEGKLKFFSTVHGKKKTAVE